MVATPMSFAAAAFEKDGRNIVIGTDRRWCEVLGDGSYTPCDKDALKCFRLNDNVALAITGMAKSMLELLALIYKDESIAETPHSEIKQVGCRGIPAHLGLGDVANMIDDSILPVVGRLRDTPYENCFGVIAAGRLTGKPTICHWGEDTAWKRLALNHPSPPACSLPPELREPKLRASWKPKLDKRLTVLGLPAHIRIGDAIKLLGEDESIVSANARPLLRSMHVGFSELPAA